jgi:hydrogenase expression/formation protein HypC
LFPGLEFGEQIMNHKAKMPICLPIPGRIKDICGDDPFTRTGQVDFGGILRNVNLVFVPEARIGDYVIVHFGLVLSTLEPNETEKAFDFLKQMDDTEEIASNLLYGKINRGL